jgi:hypothetical protein
MKMLSNNAISYQTKKRWKIRVFRKRNTPELYTIVFLDITMNDNFTCLS